ncbi:MAG: uracil-DNA glycosylase [Thermoanaerobaculia bacterium]
MPQDEQRRPRNPLAEIAAYYRDLGVAELHLDRATAPVLSAKKAAAPALAERSRAVEVVTAPDRPERLSVGGPALPTLAELAHEVAGCQTCRLCSTRNRTVFSDGDPNARLMFIGEAPGADEDASGIPFVGRAGQLLTKMIEQGMGLRRADVYIANVLKCRPPENRPPMPDEVASCRRFLEAQIALVQPEVIVGLGKFSCQFLLDSDEGMTAMRGRWGLYGKIAVMPTYHPSYLLRQPERKKDCWEDLLNVLVKLGLPAPAAQRKA